MKLPRPVDVATRGRLRMDPASWHGKVYTYWLTHGRGWKRPGGYHSDLRDRYVDYHENLCHYVRVVLFWGPLKWLANVPHDHRLKAWHVVGLVAVINGAVVWALLDPSSFWRGFVALAATLTGMGIAVGLILFFTETDPGEKTGKTIRRSASVGWHYVRAKKHRVCPLIEVKPTNDRGAE